MNEENENEDQKSPKELGVVRHVHELIKKESSEGSNSETETETNEEENEKDTQNKLQKDFNLWKAQMEADYEDVDFSDCKTVSDLVKTAKEYEDSLRFDKTGGKAGLNQPRRVSTDRTEQAESGREVITAIYNQIEDLKMKQMFSGKGLTRQENERLRTLELKRNKLLRSMREGELNRKRPTKFEIWKCPICQKIVVGHVCDRCGYRYGSRVSEEKKENWKLGIKE